MDLARHYVLARRSRKVIRGPKTDPELARLCGENSHPEFPLLRVGYSPASRYPAADFTPWIAKKLAARRFQDIASLLDQLTQANPGLGLGSQHWKDRAIQLCNLDLRRTLAFHDDEAYLDLHSALFSYALHGALDGFIIIGTEIDYLVRAISPYPFDVIDLDNKVLSSNAFIKRMRRETRDASAAWTEFPLFDKEALARSLQKEAPSPALRAKLKEATIGARQVFFGTLNEGPGQGAWAARPFGINEDPTSGELVHLDLGLLVSDPHLVLMTYKKEDLLAALEGHQTKQGWSKKYIINYMMKEAPVVADRLSAGKSVLDILPSVREDALLLTDWLQTIKDPLAIALGFG